MGFFDKAGKFAEKAGEKMARAASGVADKSKLLAEKTKLKSQISTENSNINKAYTELGKRYFEVSGENPSAEYESIISGIKTSMAHITELQQQIAALETENTCSKCGAPLKKDQQFCQTCGTKQENYVDIPAADVEVVQNSDSISDQKVDQ